MRLAKIGSPWLLHLGILSMVFVEGLILTACTAPPPRIVVQPSSQYLGERLQEPIELTYSIQNVGGRPLQIEKVSTSCGCTKVSVDKDSISPGDSTTLRVTFDPTEDNIYGDILRMIYVRSNDPATPEAEVEFRVTIQQPDE